MEPPMKNMYSKSIHNSRRMILLLLSFSTIFFLFIDAQSTCPERCSCYLNQVPRTITCSGKELTDFPQNLSDLVEHLDLSENHISEIPDDINRLSELEDLNLSRNRLTTLPSNLAGLQKLQKLILSGNNITAANELTSLSQLNFLKILHLSHNPISDLNGLQNTNLHTLDASHCGIREFGSTFLDGFPNIKTLSLSENFLTSIQKPMSETLTLLNCSDCDLTYLKSDTFEGLPNLEELIMKNNKHLIYSTRKESLRHDKLERLDVTNCNLDRPGLHNLPALTHVKLSHNGIHILPDRIFAKNRALTHIYLDANRIGHLNKSSFAGLMYLQVLDLSGNDLEEVNWSIFRDNNRLNFLNLSSNNIRDLSNLTTSAITVDLSSNLITKIDSSTLVNMPKIRTLNLSNNFIEDLSGGLESLTLRILDLKRNRLVQLGAQMFAGLPELVRLDLFGNRLTEGPDPQIFKNSPELRTLVLADNPWRCDCSQLHPIYNFLMQLPVETEMGTMICQSPANISGFSWETGCSEEWFERLYPPKNRTWGLVMISILTLVVVGGTIMSIKHAMKTKRTARNQRQSLERAEARERLRLLQRRNQRLEEELRGQSSEPRIHPMELIGPPSYEEAVHMPRLAQSLDGLDVASADNSTSVTRILGSVDNLRVKKRRSRRPRKRTLSEDNLSRREERRVERMRRNTSRITIPGNLPSVEQTPESANDLPPPPGIPVRPRIRSDSDQGGTESPKNRIRPPTPTVKKKKRIILSKAGTSTDDEDSDFQNTRDRRSIRNTIVIPNLSREPRSGYRPSSTTDNATDQ